MNDVVQPARGTLSSDETRYYEGPRWGWKELWLTPDQILALCRDERDLPAEGVSLLAEGMLNQTWKIQCTDHDRVLRVSRLERSPEQVAYEFAVVRAWTPVAPVVVAPEGDEVVVVSGHTITLFPFVSGVSGVSVPGLIRSREVVPVLAAMHRASLSVDLGQRPGFRSIDDQPPWHDWDQVRVAIMDRYGRGPDVLKPLSVVDREVEEMNGLLEAWHRSGRLAVRAPIHGDLNPRNQLYRDDHLVGIIDTDEVRVEPLAAEVAGMAYSDPAVEPGTVWRDYLAAGGPLDPRDEELLLPFARMGQLSEIIWLTDQDGAATHLALGNLTALAAALANG